MKTTETDVKKNVLKSLMKLMDSKMLSSMKPEDEEDETESNPKIQGLTIEVIGSGKMDPEEMEDEEDPLQAKLKKLFGKE